MIQPAVTPRLETPPPPMPSSAEQFDASGTRWVLERMDETGVRCWLANCSSRGWTALLEEAHRFTRREHAEAAIGASDASPVEVYEGERR